MTPMSNIDSNPNSFTPRLVLTTGEPAGIGPDVVIGISQYDYPAAVVVIADPELITERASALGVSIKLNVYDPGKQATLHRPGHLDIIPLKTVNKVVQGKPDINNAMYILESIKKATRYCLDREFDAMVTAPVNKAVINEAGALFSGHTEFIADLCEVDLPVMMLMNNHLRIALVTTHIPLSRVGSVISKDLIINVAEIVHDELKHNVLSRAPHLMVTGLNPHAGESGHLGHEETEIITPAIEFLRENGLCIHGPVPADTAFTESSLSDIDAVICMYHDQGLPVLKSQSFGEIVNLTLGLPIIRTSVDHGTALELAGTGMAKTDSMHAAITCAISLAKRKFGGGTGATSGA